MSSRKITLLSLIGILLIIYILQLTFDSKGKIKEVKPKTPITKIEIEQTGNNHLLLEKKRVPFEIGFRFQKKLSCFYCHCMNQKNECIV